MDNDMRNLRSKLVIDSLGYASQVHNIYTFDLLNKESKQFVSLLC